MCVLPKFHFSLVPWNFLKNILRRWKTWKKVIVIIIRMIRRYFILLTFYITFFRNGQPHVRSLESHQLSAYMLYLVDDMWTKIDCHFLSASLTILSTLVSQLNHIKHLHALYIFLIFAYRGTHKCQKECRSIIIIIITLNWWISYFPRFITILEFHSLNNTKRVIRVSTRNTRKVKFVREMTSEKHV